MLLFAALAIAPSGLQAQRRQASAYGYNASYQSQVIRRIPRSADEHRFRSQRYFSDKGIFYQEVPRGYIIVPAPVGLRMDRLPRGAQKIGRGRDAIYFSQGNYYVQVPRSKVYEVIPNPNRRAAYGSGRNAPDRSRGYGDRYNNDRYPDRSRNDYRDDRDRSRK
jgi:hypothetical protein